jgi:hypothetical protein
MFCPSGAFSAARPAHRRTRSELGVRARQSAGGILSRIIPRFDEEIGYRGEMPVRQGFPYIIEF